MNLKRTQDANPNFTPRLRGTAVRLNCLLSDEQREALPSRGLGYRGTVTDLWTGKNYKVYGAACSLPNCQCDAEVEEVSRGERVSGQTLILGGGPAAKLAPPTLTEADWTEIYYALRHWAPPPAEQKTRMQVLGLIGRDGYAGPTIAAVLGSSSWAVIRLAVEAKLVSSNMQSDDYMSRSWRAHLRRILADLPKEGA